MSFRPQRKGIKIKKYLIPRITQVIVLEICLALFLFALDEPTKLFSFFMSKQREFFSKNREYTHTHTEKGSLDNGYLDNLDNGSSNKYEKILKNRKKLYRYVLLLIDCW
jgi:hypothetical protein